MGFIRTMIEQRQRKIRERNDACDHWIGQMDEALGEIKSLFSAPQVFIDPREATSWAEKNASLLKDIEHPPVQHIKKAAKYKIFLSKQSDLLANAKSLSQQIQSHNDRAAGMKVPAAYSLIGDVEGHRLDLRFRRCKLSGTIRLENVVFDRAQIQGAAGRLCLYYQQ
jgi:hypothetical protein